MSRVLSALALVIWISLFAVGCSQIGSDKKQTPMRAACTEVSGEATMAAPSAARYYARKSLERSIGPARDYLGSEGLKRLRLAAARVDCAPYALAPARGGLTRCVALARLCSK